MILFLLTSVFPGAVIPLIPKISISLKVEFKLEFLLVASVIFVERAVFLWFFFTRWTEVKIVLLLRTRRGRENSVDVALRAVHGRGRTKVFTDIQKPAMVTSSPMGSKWSPLRFILRVSLLVEGVMQAGLFRGILVSALLERWAMH